MPGGSRSTTRRAVAERVDQGQAASVLRQRARLPYGAGAGRQAFGSDVGPGSASGVSKAPATTWRTPAWTYPAPAPPVSVSGP